MTTLSIYKLSLLLCFWKLSSTLVIKRQSDLFSSNDFDASLVTNSESNVGNTVGNMAPSGSRSQSYGNLENSNMMSESTSNQMGTGPSFNNGGRNSIGGGSNPFTSINNRGRNSMSSFRGPGSGNSMREFGGPGSGNAMGSFSKGGDGNSVGPFAGAAKGNPMGPFSGHNKADGSKNPFSVVKGNRIDFSKLFPLDSKYNGAGMKSPFDSSNLKGGPGGMTGGLFSTDMGTNDGPGGLNGSPFMTNNVDDGGPGGLTGSSFFENGGSNGDLANVDSKFDTSQYEHMLKEMFTTDSNSNEGNPFDPNSYNSDIDIAGTGKTSLNSAGTNNYQQYNSGHTGSGSYSSGRETSDPFSTKHFKDSSSPFKVHQTYQVGADSRPKHYTTYYDRGSYQRNNHNADTYQTPFNEKTDYNELLSTPFQSSADNSRTASQGYNDQSFGTQYSPFKADRGMTGLARMNNPGGNPFSQAGSQIGRG